jgi:hypothetical protein
VVHFRMVQDAVKSGNFVEFLRFVCMVLKSCGPFSYGARCCKIFCDNNFLIYPGIFLESVEYACEKFLIFL